MCRLAGLRIVVTRAKHQAEELARPLRDLGADVILAPVIGIAPAADPAPLREAAGRCDQYDWIIFTSANAVLAFAAELIEPPPPSLRVAAIGAATREAAEKSGFAVSVVPREYVAESLVESLGAQNLAGKRVLIPAAAVAREVVPQTLAELGAQVERVEAYRNVIPPGAEQRITEVFRDPYPDWVTFTSSSAAENTCKLAATGALQQVKIASIGPITSATVRKLGLVVTAEARVPGAAGLAEAICATDRFQR